MAESTPPTNEVIEMKEKGAEKGQIIQELQNKGYSQQQIADALNQAEIKQGVQGKMDDTNQSANSEMQVSAMDQDMPAPDAAMPENEEDDIPVPTPTPPPQDNMMQSQGQPQAYAGGMGASPYAAGAYQQSRLPPSQPMVGGAYEDVQSLVEEIINEKWRELLSSIGDITTWKAQITDQTEAMKQEILRVQSRFDNLQGAILGKVDEYGTSVRDIGTEMRALEKVFEKILEPMTANIKELTKITEDLRNR